MDEALKGKCLCGKVTVTVTARPGWIGVCHCRVCQRWSGGIWAGFPAPEADVTVVGAVKVFASSPIAERAFCGECGTQLWMKDTKAGSDYDMMPGLFDGAKGWPLRSEIYTDEAYSAFDLAGDHPCATTAEYRAKNPEVAEVPHG